MVLPKLVSSYILLTTYSSDRFFYESKQTAAFNFYFVSSVQNILNKYRSFFLKIKFFSAKTKHNFVPTIQNTKSSYEMHATSITNECVSKGKKKRIFIHLYAS